MRRLAYKFRMYPTEQQAALIERTFGCVRAVWNLMLADAKENYRREGSARYSTPAYYKIAHGYLKEVDSLALCNAQMNLKRAFSQYFNDKKESKKKRKTGFPRWKTRKRSRSAYTTNCTGGNQIRIEHKKLRLPKLGYVKVIFHQHVDGVIKSATISKTKSNHFYVSILVEQADNQPTKPVNHANVVGIDMSFSDIAVYSDGTRLKHPRWYRKEEKRIACAQRRLHKRKFGSKGREKQRLRVAKLCNRLARKRRDFFHKETRRLVDQYDVLVFEDINLMALARKGRRKRHGKSVYDMAFGLFRCFVEYKAGWQRKVFCKADRFYASTQLCSFIECRKKNSALRGDLSVRGWVCQYCGTTHDRDVNAAKNLVLWYENYFFSTGASPGIHAEGDLTSTGAGNGFRKLGRRARKSCRTVDPVSLSRGS